LLQDDAVESLIKRIFPLATVITPNVPEAEHLAGGTASPKVLAERLYELGAPGVIVTGGHAEKSVDHLFDGNTHTEIPVDRHDRMATHGAGCTHSATLAALLANGETLVDAAIGAARIASEAVERGLLEIGHGDSPVDVLDIPGRQLG
jgi:hydroxymethylpyrimidine/phosphomethylpyrimidine kinase